MTGTSPTLKSPVFRNEMYYKRKLQFMFQRIKNPAIFQIIRKKCLFYFNTDACVQSSFYYFFSFVSVCLFFFSFILHPLYLQLFDRRQHLSILVAFVHCHFHWRHSIDSLVVVVVELVLVDSKRN